MIGARTTPEGGRSGQTASVPSVRSTAGNVVLVSALVGWGVNVIALLVIDSVFGGVEIRRWGPILIGAAVLSIGNAVVKPMLAVLTLPLILVTLGISYFALNVAMLALAEWIAPRFSIDGFWTYIGATIVVWLVNWVLHHLLEEVVSTSS
jgi:putative membrane protein